MIDNIYIEYDTEKLIDKTLPEPDLLDYYNRLARREIMLNCEIDDSCVDYAKQIIEWNIRDKDIPVIERKPIKIFINSCGGLVSAAWTLIDTMIASETPIITVGLGCIYSAASMIFIAGHKRLCLPHATYMIHDGYIQNSDSVAKMIDDIEFQKTGEEKVKQYYISRTNITESLYDEKYRVNWYMQSEDMLKYGIADTIISSLSEV